ncbi:MAG: carbamate kinase [Candidatus Micrarchaeota archaeon]|nr:carbamate kinase [Candidatus Micrarchaeota archaeon]
MLNVLSIGGNALESSKNLNSLLDAVQLLSKKGKLLITHGNGPQVGMLADIEKQENLGILTAQTEAQIGVHLQEEILKRFSKKGSRANVETVLTRVLVDSKDIAFKLPSKPIGKFYTKAQAAKLSRKFKMKLLLHGYRRVVPSPRPKKILNMGSIEALLSKNNAVIAGGGGGIPIIYRGSYFDFADAVIDKDYTSALLAKSLRASRLFILTNVDGAYLNMKGDHPKMIGKISVRELAQHVRFKEFEEGSMKPNVEACIDFVRSTGGIAAIGNLKKATDVIKLRNCTVIS